MRPPKPISSRFSPWSFEAQVSSLALPTTIQDRRRREFCCSLLPPRGFGDRQTKKSAGLLGPADRSRGQMRLERFRAKWKPVRVKKTRQNKRGYQGNRKPK